MDSINYDGIIVKAPPTYDFTLYTPVVDNSLFKNAIDDENPDAFLDYRSATGQLTYSYPGTNISPMNLQKILEFYNQVKEGSKLIVEIGVVPNLTVPNSTTNLLKVKPDNCAYLGIDCMDRSYVYNLGTNVHLMKIDSKDTETIIEKVKELGGVIDFLFIDGDHSINQVKHELALIPYVRKGGVIGFHDIAAHIGPNVWMKAFDSAKFDIFSYTAPADWGVGFLVKKF